MSASDTPMLLEANESQPTGKRKRESDDQKTRSSKKSKKSKTSRAGPSPLLDSECLAELAEAAVLAANAALAAGVTTVQATQPRLTWDDGEVKQDRLYTVHVKVKEDEAFKLPSSDVQALLQDTPHLSISPTPYTVYVRPRTLTALYKCTDGNIFQGMPAEHNPSGETSRRIVHLQPKEQLAMPLLPGNSGLLLPAPDLRLINDNCTWTVFRRVGTKGNGGTDCVYLGEYEIQAAGKMTKEQFCAQDPKVQNCWAKRVLLRGRYFIKMRARIALRKAGVLPAQDLESEEALVNEEVVKMRKKQGKPVDPDDALQALRRGNEAFDILRMRCVSYDHQFIRHVETAIAAWKQGKKEAHQNIYGAGILGQH